MGDDTLTLDPTRLKVEVDILKILEEFFHTSPFACDPSSLPRFHHGKESESTMAREEKRNKSGRLHKDRTRKHRAARKKKDINIVENAEPCTTMSKQETIPGMSDYQDSNINVGDASTSQNVMRPQQRSVASPMSPINAIIKKISPTTEIHPKGRKNVVPGHTNWDNGAMPSTPNPRLTRDMRSTSVLNFFPNRTPNKEEQTTRLLSLADSQEGTTKTEKTAA